MDDIVNYQTDGLGPSIDINAMRLAAESASNLMKVLANSDRLLLLCHLTQHEKSVGELENLTGIKQPSLSQQLSVLRESKLVSTRRESKNIYYQLASTSAMKVLQVLYQEYCSK